MLGIRGASRYISEAFKPSFELECEAIKRVRNEMNLKNLEIMFIPHSAQKISLADRRLKGGFGIMFDDVIAGGLAWMSIQLIIHYKIF